jgi:hypothetical protein
MEGATRRYKEITCGLEFLPVYSPYTLLTYPVSPNDIQTRVKAVRRNSRHDFTERTVQNRLRKSFASIFVSFNAVRLKFRGL